MSSTEVTTAASSRTAPARGQAVRRRTQTERSDEMRLRLVEAAAATLRKKGYAGLRTDEVARVANVSRGALQHHFPSKDGLVVATAEHLLRRSLERGRSRAGMPLADAEPVAPIIEAIIQDGLDFFLGPDFGVVLDLVLAGSKSRALREHILDDARHHRLGVEAAWIEVLASAGVPRGKAEKAVWLTIGLVRGLAVRALWQNDPALFRDMLDEWKTILVAHLKTTTREDAR